MPRYYFDTKDGGRDIDNHGIELADEEAAIGEAIRYAGDLLSDQPEMVAQQGEMTVTARAEAQREIAKVRVELQR